MYYTYILRSIKRPGASYIGYTVNLRKRLRAHNSPDNKGYTRRFAPWEIESYFVFTDSKQAKDFELYLKSSSGRAFMKKHLVSEGFRRASQELKNSEP